MTPALDPRLVSLGWTSSWAEVRDAYEAGLEDPALAAAVHALEVARVASEHKGGHVILLSDGEALSEMGAALRPLASDPMLRPTVGDWVLVRRAEGLARPTLEAVLPRRTALTRKAPGRDVREQVVAANVDRVFIATALDGDFSVSRVERYLALVWASGAEPVVVLTKTDRAEDVARAVAEVRAVAGDAPVHAVSAKTGEGLGELAAYLNEPVTVAIVGSSGVGKSTLVNAWVGEARQETGDVRADGKGRHTTTRRELVPTRGGALLVDTPGMREVGLFGADAGLDKVFADVASLVDSCRFRDCRHRDEPGCAVREALTSGALSEERYGRYARLRTELDDHARESASRTRAQKKAEGRRLSRAVRAHQKLKGR